jgi:hypothetical protein
VDRLLQSYESGSETMESVRSQLVAVMGGTERVVSAPSGVWVRDADGRKLRPLSRNTKLTACKRLEQDDLPASISGAAQLARYAWGTAKLGEETVLFPWELTLSMFAKEIVENTAKRTAEEIVRLTEGKGWSRPVHIQVTTTPDSKIKISHSAESGEVYVTADSPEEVAEQ